MDFIETFSEYGIDVEQRGAVEQRAICPKCMARKGSTSSKDLAVNIEKGTWFCHSAHCGWAGGLKKKKDFIRPKYRTIKPKSKPLNDSFYKWFSSRGISKEIVDRNKITIDKVWMPGADKEVPSVCFNYYVGDELINIKYRDIEKNFRQEKDADKILYKLNDIEGESECIITEGEMDALSFEVAGYKYAVSIPDGAVNPNLKNVGTKFSYLDNCAEYFENMKKIYLALDTDQPGLRTRDELARRLGRYRCFIVQFPEDCKDANEVLQKYGKDSLAACITSAEPFPVEGIYYAKDKSEELKMIYENGYPKGAKTTVWQKFDSLIKFYDSILTVITGIPSHGKSNFMDHLMIILAVENGWKFGVFSSENAKIEIHLHRLCEIVIGNNLLPGYNNRMSEEDMNKALDFINAHFFFILPKDEEYTIDNILNATSFLVLKHGIKGLILDPWNTLVHDYGKDTETEYTKKMLNRLTYFERNHGLNLFIIAHPAKMRKRKDSSKYEVPSLYDISGSSHWYNKTEVGISVYREYAEDYSQTLHTSVIVEKVKHKFMGKPGYVKFDFDTKSQRYYERDSTRFEGSYLDKFDNKYDDEVPF